MWPSLEFQRRIGYVEFFAAGDLSAQKAEPVTKALLKSCLEMPQVEACAITARQQEEEGRNPG